MNTVPLNVHATVTLDGSGNGTAQIGPNGHGLVWHPAVASIRMGGPVPTGLATVTVYAGDDTSAANFVDATYNVNNAATDSIAGASLQIGQYVSAVWAGGNPHTVATLTVTGTKDIP